MFVLSVAGVGASSGVALYSGLGAGIVAVATLVAAVVLYRRSHSQYGEDVMDASALAGGFQSFHFKTTRQGEEGGEDRRGRFHGCGNSLLLRLLES